MPKNNDSPLKEHRNKAPATAMGNERRRVLNAFRHH